MSKRKLFFLALALLLLSGCAKPQETTPAIEEQSVEISATEAAITNSNTLTYTEFDANEYPNYVKLYDIPCTVDIELKPGEVQFSELDELGRSGRAVANVDFDLVEESKGWRTEFASNSDPSGWGHNGEVEIPLEGQNPYRGWFWNRSHLIADSLGGYTHVYNTDGSVNEETSTTPKTNLITGTRTQNVGKNDGNGGMAFFETATRDWLYEHPDDTVWYSARPVYEGDELVPRSVIVSLTNPDHSFELVGEVFNAAEGFDIDYLTGEFAPAN